ncbi:uncharacterized protein LOC134232121 [Saccostrea cucullata]|uniref:uncharacterized protein LOC134232121 n=1 Tax=Saccostrea cuccullata TaxID=36930 RepID=UPI002ED2601E
MKREAEENGINAGKMIENSQQSKNEGIQMVGVGAAIGSVLGPVGTVVGGIVGGIFCIFLCHHDNRPPPNQMPKFTFCPKSGDEIFADDGQDAKIYSWTLPKAADPEDGNLEVHLRQGSPPGKKFPRGEHTIIYEATDKNGALASCYFSFTVKVLTCEFPQWPLNGFIRCNKPEITAGTTCRVGCYPGFQMAPNTPEIKCVSANKKASFDATVPSCQEITCPVNVTEMKPQHGMALCTNNRHKYDSACTTQCEKGYSLTTMMLSVCQKDRTWSTKLPDCEDSDPPEIKRCPSTIYAYTDRNRKSATVTWKEPTVVDNSNKTTLERTVGLAPGSTFRVGLTEIRYKATDASGNESPECIFFVAVEELRCAPPLIIDKYMLYQCPDGFTYGAKCHLHCMGRFPLVGNETIVCEKNSTTVQPYGYWDKGGVEPYCKRIPCRDLPAPINGAMSCDTWMFGRQCQMQCSDKYDIPALGSSTFNGVFTCSEKQGVFMPSNTVPNCTELRLPGHIETLGEFFYYTGSCGDGKVMEQIKSNFIKQMEFLEKNGFAGVCSDSNECNVGNVSVTCGPSSSRKRRAVDFEENVDRLRRSGSEIRVEIKLSSVWKNSNSTRADSLQFAKQIQKKMFDKVQELGNDGKLTVNGIAPDSGSFVLGFTAPVCPPGLAIRLTTLTCAPCAKGSYLTEDHRKRPVCTSCPKGFFKEDEFELQCAKCPEGTGTVEEGSTYSTDCIDTCQPGEYSETGLFPCTPCEKSSFQNASMSTSCVQCPTDLTTAFRGSTDEYNCTNFDVLLKQRGSRIDVKKPSKSTAPLGITIMTWLKSPSSNIDLTLYHSRSLGIRIQDKIIMEKASLRNWIATDVSLQNGTWVHIAIVIQKTQPVATVFINGKEEFASQGGFSISDADIQSGLEDVNILLNSNTESGVSLSGYQVVSQPLPSGQIIQSAKTCHAKSATSFISMEDMKNLTKGDVEIIVPSQCDDINECENDPCHGHQCVDRVKGYACQCSNGYHGKNCEIKPDLCKHQPCKNGATCANTDQGNYTCFCIHGFKGIRCEKKIVNGGWSSWSQFSECSVSCNGGTKVRTRVCNSPSPDPEGMPCNASDAIEHVSCNTEKCPSCSHLRRSFGNVPHCRDTSDGHKVCTVTCRLGYAFVPGHIPLPEYVCGRNTSYKWTGEPPACGRVDVPEQISTITIVSYKDPIACDEASKASVNLKEKLETSVQCAKNKTCIVSVEAKECSSTNRKKRAASTQSQEVTLTTPIGEKIDVQNIAQTQQTNDAAKKYIISVSELEYSVQQLNTSNDMLNLIVDGKIYIATGKTTRSTIHCPDGQGRVLFFCADCPQGTHSSSGKCILCNLGTYQDEAGQTTCKQCPLGTTTNYVGSQSQLDCIVKKKSTEKKKSSQHNHDGSQTLIIIATTLSLLIFCGFSIGVGIYGYKRYQRYRLRNNQKMNGSWASLSMVSPSEFSARDYVPPLMESKPKLTM